eukprot:TRINITY_DN20992_c0_g1_i1.p1 TRINITY_DN20992_c0_g1~~TRINITY_DN20992_c0_g1_i1.p1  ORF type:complete len:358 (-),score=41.79 TRINITY_DN20992_c0_g1_i1:804-1877(-)
MAASSLPGRSQFVMKASTGLSETLPNRPSVNVVEGSSAKISWAPESRRALTDISNTAGGFGVNVTKSVVNIDQPHKQHFAKPEGASRLLRENLAVCDDACDVVRQPPRCNRDFRVCPGGTIAAAFATSEAMETRGSSDCSRRVLKDGARSVPDKDSSGTVRNLFPLFVSLSSCGPPSLAERGPAPSFSATPATARTAVTMPDNRDSWKTNHMRARDWWTTPFVGPVAEDLATNRVDAITGTVSPCEPEVHLHDEHSQFPEESVELSFVADSPIMPRTPLAARSALDTQRENGNNIRITGERGCYGSPGSGIQALFAPMSPGLRPLQSSGNIRINLERRCSGGGAERCMEDNLWLVRL